MALPYPTKVVLPFDIATAQDMNERHANDVALAAGTGLDDGAVTPDKRGGGFKVGIIPGSTFGSAGNKNITGVGFKPKLVEFSAMPTDSTTIFSWAYGAMTEGSQYMFAGTAFVNAGSRTSRTNRCIGYITATASSTLGMSAQYVSMNEDGFTINVVDASTSFDIAYKAYG